MTGLQILWIAVAVNSTIVTTFSCIVAGALVIIHFLLVDDETEEEKNKR